MQLPIFQPNNHSKWQISYRPVTTLLKGAIEAIFIKHYAKQGDSVISVEQVDETEINSNNFKVTFLRDRKEECILIRRYAHKRDHAMLEASALVLGFLREKGMRVPEIIRSRSGNTFETDDNYTYAAFHFLHGHHYRGTLSEVADIAREFARLQNAFDDLPNKEELLRDLVFPPEVHELRRYSSDIWKELICKAKDKNSLRNDPVFDERLCEFSDLILDAVEQTPSLQYENVAKKLVHFDLHPHNILTDGETLLAIIDFDSLRALEPMRAVAFALHRVIRQHIVFTQPSDISAAVKSAQTVFLDAYQKEKLLSRDEIDSIPYFIRSEAIARLSHAMKDYYINNNSSWKENLEKQTAAILEAKYFV
jgi:Ser/Thr protein kinase RdoA (MazF antagonist)